MAKFKLTPGTDGIYSAYGADGSYMGKVKKVYTGRSSYVWTIEPAHYHTVQLSTLRVGYATRNEAYEALAHYAHTGKRSLVEG